MLCPNCDHAVLYLDGMLDESNAMDSELCCPSCNETFLAGARLEPLAARLSDPTAVHCVRKNDDAPPSGPPADGADPEGSSPTSTCCDLPKCLHGCASGGEQVRKTLKRLATGELSLPAQEMKIAEQCPECGAEGSLEANPELLKSMRQKPAEHATEPCALKCTACSHECTVSGHIDAAFESGYQRLFSKPTRAHFMPRTVELQRLSAPHTRKNADMGKLGYHSRARALMLESFSDNLHHLCCSASRQQLLKSPQKLTLNSVPIH